MNLESMNTQQAWDLVGGLSKPSKMPGWSYGLPAKECKTGSKLRLVKGSTCYGCYALKGCYVFSVVQKAQYKRLASIKHPLWTGAMSLLINSKKSNVFRWHDSGDVQDLDHLNKIYAVCHLTPSRRHWMPTREAWTLKHLDSCPKNLIVRFSMPMVGQAPAGSWPHTSTVVDGGASCPSSSQGNQCRDCRKCWNKEIPNISYGLH